MNLHFMKGLVMWYMHLPFRINSYIKNNKRNVERIRKKDSINVIFFASNLAMWRYQGLYEEMQKYPRFKTYIVLSPLAVGYNKAQRIHLVEQMRKYFQEKNIDYIDYDTTEMKCYDVKNLLKPDILFYSQPYYTIMQKEHRYYNFKDSLLAYYPYYFHISESQFAYNEDFHNRAWKLFYESEYHKKVAKRIATIGDRNVEVVGCPLADYFFKVPRIVWKSQNKDKKRIIWAPHFTINNNGWFQNSEFLSMATFMLEIADKYNEEIQFAFKPHPKLRSELYNHKDWGKDRTDLYYKIWETKENCQLESGSYYDLFMTSDGMIHDSGSFSVEYLYTIKPVMYTCRNMEEFLKQCSDFSKKIYDQHYIGYTQQDVENFIENRILKQQDTKKGQRILFREEYLLPPKGKTVAENTMEIINDSLKKI